MTLRALATALVLTLAAALPAGAASFRPNVTVDADDVTLADLFDGAGATGTQIVARAPAPGRRMVFDAKALSALAHAYGVDWQSGGPHDRTIVERSAIVVGGDRIQSMVEAALAGQGVAKPFTAVFDRRANQIALPTGADEPIVQSITFDPVQQRFSGMLEAASPSGPIAIPVSGRTVRLVEVPVLNRRFTEGEVIAAADIALVQMQADRVARDALQSVQDIVGRSTDRALEAQRPLRLRDLKRDLIVKRGQTVTLMLDDPAMSITTQGRALMDAAKGEMVRVLNTTSSRVVEGHAIGINLVAVPTALPSMPMQTASADPSQTPSGDLK